MANENRAFSHDPGISAVCFPKIFIFQERIGSKSNIRSDGVGCQDTVSVRDIDVPMCFSLVLEDSAEFIDVDFDLRFKLVDRAESEEILVHANTATMDFVIFGSERDFGDTRDFVVPGILFKFTGRGVKVVVEVWIIDMDLMGIDSNDRTYDCSVKVEHEISQRRSTVFLVHLFDFEDIFPSKPYIMISLIPECESSEFWARESCERMKVEAIDTK